MRMNTRDSSSDMNMLLSIHFWRRRASLSCAKPVTFGRGCSLKLQILLLFVLQGPASQQVHRDEVKTLISEAVQAKQAEHVTKLTRLQQGFEAQLQECEEDLKDHDRYHIITCNTVRAEGHWGIYLLLLCWHRMRHQHLQVQQPYFVPTLQFLTAVYHP